MFAWVRAGVAGRPAGSLHRVARQLLAAEKENFRGAFGPTERIKKANHSVSRALSSVLEDL